MVARVRSAGLAGVDGYELFCECDISGGLPAFDIVGLPDAAVKESRERVRAAIKNCGFEFPARRITVNLAPADTKKAGAMYDLPILLSILSASGQINPIPLEYAFAGELSLEGGLRPIAGALPLAIALPGHGATHLFLPDENASEAAFAGKIIAIGVSDLRMLEGMLAGGAAITPARPDIPQKLISHRLDYRDVKGQENAKRAIEVAAAGGHNILLYGPPGSGKSMLARRLPSILPDMTHEETLESTKLHSVAGLTSRGRPVVTERPFRSPHHTISSASLCGGGRVPRPGEISLGHNGVLFLDELPEFAKDALEGMRQPLEDGVVTISRVSGTVAFPCRFMLVGAMNPCKCGWYGTPGDKCTCSKIAVENYRSKISGPLLDRMDIHIEVPSSTFEELKGQSATDSSAVMKARVDAARERQTRRFAGGDIRSNAQMGPAEIERFCVVSASCEALLKAAFDRLGMTGRGYHRILKTARTIADIEGCDNIAERHIAEAIQYRNIDRGGV